MKKNYALISVYDKKNIHKICEVLKANKIDIIATESTSIYIKKIGYKCENISKYTKYNQMLDGRVKTINPLIFASILFDRKNNDHINFFSSLKFPLISFVIVNLYPFAETIKKEKKIEKNIEMIDIGGTSLLRAAAKNFKYVTAISSHNDYDKLIKNLKKNNGKTTLEFRRKKAMEVFKVVSNYDNLISNSFSRKENEFKFNKHKKRLLRYGENPHQNAYFINNSIKNSFLDNCIKIGKGLSYNNMLDINSAYECVCDFSEPTCVIVKHNNPCGVSSNKNIAQAYKNALSCDPKSAFGGIVSLNRNIDKKLAKIISLNFFEIIIAPSFAKKAIEIFNKSKNIILISTSKIKKVNNYELKSINDGYLFQQKNNLLFSLRNMNCVTKKKATKNQIKDLIFSFKVAKHVKSNAIVLVKNKSTVGIGAGQSSRVDSTKFALSKMKYSKNVKGFVAASDAFFPFIDSVNLLYKNKCSAIIQPMGSKNDNIIKTFANNKNLPIYFSKYRFFKH